MRRDEGQNYVELHGFRCALGGLAGEKLDGLLKTGNET